MKAFRVAAAALVALFLASYAQATSLEGLLGTRLPTPAGEPAGPADNRIIPKEAPKSAITRSAIRFAVVLANLQADEPSSHRGANEERIYQIAAPSVVLVVTDDGLGSGAVIGADGLIVTSLHVVGKNSEVGVVFKPKVEGATITKADIFVAHVVRRDELTDLALIQVLNPPPGVPILAVGSSADVSIGADVNAIGHPTGEAWTYTRGIVSQIRNNFSWTGDLDKELHTANVIQTQTPISPGNSGGPLLSDDLKIVGINAFKSEGEGLNFAVAGENIQTLLTLPQDRLIAAAPQSADTGPACQWKILSQQRTEDPIPGTLAGVDSDCTGKVAFVMLTPDDQSKPVVLMYSSSASGNIDALLFVDRQGEIEYGLYDTVGDGKFHLKGYFRPGESKPYRYENVDD